MKKAIITGITGQDGSFLTEFLLEKGYEIHGIIRRSSSFNTQRIDHLYNNSEIYGKTLFLHYGDLTDSSCLNRLIEKIQPDEIYNLGAQSHVACSFDVPEYTAEVDGIGVLKFLDAIKNNPKQIKFYQASTSELFGGLPETAPQNENTSFCPKSPYGVAKLYAYWIVKNYRESYNLFAVNGILFNHESERRGETFLTRKITKAIANILKGTQDIITLGNLDSQRDWGYSPDYCEAMWLMLQQDIPHDLVIATGETRTVREFAEEAFRCINIELKWRGKGLDEEGYDSNTGRVWIKVDSKYFRLTEVDLLLGDSTKARQILGWQPKTTFKELVSIMMAHDLKEAGVTL